MKTVSEIIEAAGGTVTIHKASVAACEGTSDKPLSKDAIYKWPTIGIQDRHWPLLMKLSDVTPEELFQANMHARGHASDDQGAAQ